MQKIMESSIKKINGMVHDPLAEDGGQKSACNLCMEKFDSEIRMEATLKCGHVACIKCLTEMSEKICHICRKEFKNEEIIKLYY
ncbi:Oidioi.mRNA.OKI2018_I69.PAR.g12225.t1.cds [Oikopleura dioica]|uniref:Oidioi.mRNA.OKI2018_I69.PAR.g12225.t1.cds n=1 Tax=Oikopleura dioica TaxID=34765 RepID=A0ABN7S3M1_OIKDI|nr:Oidioi.mRNA.OKI2018_I69.PAR.g12225.t1.cds [Oikopleura dioica]